MFLIKQKRSRVPTPPRFLPIIRFITLHSWHPDSTNVDDTSNFTRHILNRSSVIKDRERTSRTNNSVIQFHRTTEFQVLNHFTSVEINQS